MADRTAAKDLERIIRDELTQIGNRHPRVPRRDLDYILTVALRLANETAREALAELERNELTEDLEIFD